MAKITQKTIQKSFDGAVDKYAGAVEDIGLWKSEEWVFTKYFGQGDQILDIGCGTGRTTFGLYERGFKNITGLDYSPTLLSEAEKIKHKKGYEINFIEGDAMNLPFGDESFDQALFSFNGLMQIPQRKNRLKALKETLRVLKPGGYFIFTTHDRDQNENFLDFWEKEKKHWEQGEQDSRIYEYGDIIIEEGHGEHISFVHIPNRQEVEEDLREPGFTLVEDFYREDHFTEYPHVQTFSAECRFWVARK